MHRPWQMQACLVWLPRPRWPMARRGQFLLRRPRMLVLRPSLDRARNYPLMQVWCLALMPRVLWIRERQRGKFRGMANQTRKNRHPAMVKHPLAWNRRQVKMTRLSLLLLPEGTRDCLLGNVNRQLPELPHFSPSPISSPPPVRTGATLPARSIPGTGTRCGCVRHILTLS